MKIYFMRHGETAWNEQGLLQGSTDIPLNEYGKQLAELTREGLKAENVLFDRVFSSPYQRAAETARIITAGTDMEFTVDERLREMCFGKYEGMKISDIMEKPENEVFARFFKAPEKYCSTGASESFEEASDRAREFLEECILPLEKECDRVLVVCHGAIVRVFLCLIGKISLEDYWKISQPNCCVSTAELKDGELTLTESGKLYYEQKKKAGRKFV